MNNVNLLLTFKWAGDAVLQARTATRIRVDGLGGLVVYDAATGEAERLPLESMNSLCIDSATRRVSDVYIH